MPLHLLGKKSWNVYNQDNIERVRRDEAQAKAREEEDIRRRKEADAQERLQILRGNGSLEVAVETLTESTRWTGREELDSFRKRRRLAGEDDTERDIRIAREEAGVVSTGKKEHRRKPGNAPITDENGHIDLFPEERRRPSDSTNDCEMARKKRESEDQYSLRFSNAGGKGSGSDNPWYLSGQQDDKPSYTTPSTDVWGNDDPNRRERETKRMYSNDPLAAMNRGVRQLRQVERDREEWKKQREKDLNEVETLARLHRKRRRRRSSDDESLENFSLGQRNDGSDRPEPRHSRHRTRRHHGRHHRERDKLVQDVVEKQRG